MPNPCILIISDVKGAAQAYEAAVSSLGASCDLVGSFDDALKLAVDKVYSGVLIDIVTLVRCGKDQKLIAYDFINIYPCLRVRWDHNRNEILLGTMEQALGVDPRESLRLFIINRCSALVPRRLRKYPRVNVSLKLWLCPGEQFVEEESIRTFTVNLSLGGAFIHTMAPFRKGDTVWMRFREFDDPDPVRGTVRWWLDWDFLDHSIPGIGVEFGALSESQQEGVARLVRR